MKVRALTTMLVIALGSAALTSAQVRYPPETKNAALRYWMAFAEMQDLSVDKDTQNLLEKTAAGEATWDEARLGPLLKANAGAIELMQRATKLPDCDWGWDYGRGAQASMAYAPWRARALARLNALEGLRQMAMGDSQSAVNTWLAGIRFSQHLAHGGPVFFALVANASLLPDLRLLTESARKGQLNEAQKKQVSARVRGLREDGLDWVAAWAIDSATGEHTLQELRSAGNPSAPDAAVVGKASPQEDLPPTLEDIQQFRQYMGAVGSALREPPMKAKTSIEQLEAEKARLGEVAQNMIPNAQRVNLIRIEATTTRAELLHSVNVGEGSTP